MEFIVLVIVGLVAGALAGRLTRGTGFGIVGDVVVGLVGALIGGFVLSLLGLPTGGNIIWSIVVATAGAVLLLWIVGFFSGSRTTA